MARHERDFTHKGALPAQKKKKKKKKKQKIRVRKRAVEGKRTKKRRQGRTRALLEYADVWK
jgi:hypothetical protein